MRASGSIFPLSLRISSEALAAEKRASARVHISKHTDQHASSARITGVDYSSTPTHRITHNAVYRPCC
ncbi:hypothetical protein BS47DRAFT_1344987 [Hydnum rufescens UP504]|uniref:Uncharacterized protein n=1 Tax=Hydnum rufescens UP504 TaxID=1448309 RepID=A0A9P6AW29_9AGAM|nr:hypothetical protein BS47DRAFT_1344987 [Hydnum rufescens UP504]